jgi:hypothetical protein
VTFPHPTNLPQNKKCPGGREKFHRPQPQLIRELLGVIAVDKLTTAILDDGTE